MQFPSSIRSKLPNTGTTIFTTMSALAAEHGAINLSQGFPDFSSPPELIRLVEEYMRKGMNQYAPMPGLLALRERLAEKAQDLYKAKVDPVNEVTITSGGTQAIYTAIAATVHEGDEVILFTPAYDCYSPAIQLNGGRPIYIELELPDYHINWETVKKRITQRTRMIIINTPHNPTGAVLTKKDMKALQKLVQGSDILILSDEVYEHIIFDGQQHESVLKYPVLAERSFAIFSFGKTYHNTGWKVGYCIAPENLMKEFRKVHQYLVFSTNTPIQYALADFLDKKDEYLQLSSFYQEKRDFFAGLLKKSRFKVLPSKGTYFQLLNYSGITDEKDTEYAIRLTKEIGVASIPISVFYHNNVDNKILRFCFAKGNETLEKAAEKLCRI
jgi:methionine aminotransferase